MTSAGLSLSGFENLRARVQDVALPSTRAS
jgi:hypothetical protein